MKKSLEVTTNNGVLHPYIYMNYAMKDDDVFSSYGAENMQNMLEIKKRHDPDDAFWKIGTWRVQIESMIRIWFRAGQSRGWASNLSLVPSRKDCY